MIKIPIPENFEFPEMHPIRQQFDIPPAIDVIAAVTAEWEKLSEKLTLAPHARIAVGVGSRGLSNLTQIVRTVVDLLKEAGARPFITSAMGSHGRATAGGQLEVLARRGITRESVGAPVEVTMEVDLIMLSFRLARDPAERESLWQVRRSIHGALMGLCPKWLEEDISVPPASIPLMLENLQVLAGKENLRILCFGHYADGNIHLSVSEADSPLTPARAEMVEKEIFVQTMKLGGRIAAEHGIGSVKKEYLGLNLDGATLNLALGIKKLLDPKGILNPGKIFPRSVWDKAYRGE